MRSDTQPESPFRVAADNAIPQDDDEISLLDLLLVISENIRLLVLGPLLAGLAALGIAFTMTPVFTAKTSVFLPASTASGGSAAALLDQLGPIAGIAGIAGVSGGGTSQALIVYLESETLRDRLIEKHDLKKAYDVKLFFQARNRLAAATEITLDRKTNLVKIGVTDRDPKFAALLANSYVEYAREMMGAIASENARRQRELLERQIEEALKKPYQNPVIRDAVVQGLIRQAESARIEESRREGPFLTQVDIARPPELKSGPKKAQIAIIAALAAGFVLLIFVFARQAYRNSQDNPESQKKIARLKAAFWLTRVKR